MKKLERKKDKELKKLQKEENKQNFWFIDKIKLFINRKD